MTVEEEAEAFVWKLFNYPHRPGYQQVVISKFSAIMIKLLYFFLGQVNMLVPTSPS